MLSTLAPGASAGVTDDSGTLITQQRYFPFGGARELANYQTSGLTDFTYTGQPADSRPRHGWAHGLLRSIPKRSEVDKARFYSPILGRFIQPDTLIPDYTNPQAWNRFSYVANRPVNYNDPTGHCFTGVVIDTMICADVLIAVGIFVVALEVTAYYMNNTPHGQQIRDRAAAGFESLETNIKKKIGGYTSTRQQDMTDDFHDKANDVNSGKRFPNLFKKCFESISNAVGCVSLITLGVKIVNDSLTTGGCGEDESYCKPPTVKLETFTPTATGTPTSTPTPTSTYTYTPTFTSTPTRTPTFTPSPTYTPTNTPIPTPSSQNRTYLQHGR